MKSIIVIFLSLGLLLATSCSSCHEVTVNGKPGTKIYNYEICVGTIGDDGQTEVALARGVYYPYLYSKSPNSQKRIPFALNYKNSNKYLPAQTNEDIIR